MLRLLLWIWAGACLVNALLAEVVYGEAWWPLWTWGLGGVGYLVTTQGEWSR